MIKVILFDLDGVLVDACNWHYLALNRALKQCGFSKISEQDHVEKFNGLPTHVKLKMMNISDDDAKKINNLKQDITFEIINENAKLMPEKIELHTFLKDNGIKIGCVTNSIRKTAEHMLKKTGQYKFMDIIITNEDVIKNKPNPDCYNLAIKMIDAQPSTVMCVEDSEKGILAASTSIAGHILIVKNTEDVNVRTIKNKLEKLL